MNRLVVLLALGLGLGACAKDEAPATTSAEVTSTKPATKGPEIPVAADFEEEVRAEITADNYQAELAKIEAELSN